METTFAPEFVSMFGALLALGFSQEVAFSTVKTWMEFCAKKEASTK